MAVAAMPEIEVLTRVEPEVLRRGEGYFQAGNVLWVARRGRSLLAEVAGSEAEPYRVSITSDQHGRSVTAECTCPYAVEEGRWCKHMAAVVLFAARRPDAVEEQPPLDSVVSALTAEQLREVVRSWAEHDPDAYDVILAAASRGDAGAPLEPAAAAEAARRRIHRILAERTPPFRDEQYGRWIARETATLVREAAKMVEDGDAASALAVLDAVTGEYVDVFLDLHPAAQETAGDVFPALTRAWTEAVLTADPADDERRALEETLEAWDEPLSNLWVDGFQGVLGALRGDSVAVPEDGDDPSSEAEAVRRALAEARLAVLERAGKLEDAVKLAREAGLDLRCCLLLLRLDRVDEACAHARAHLDMRADSLALAQALWEAGNLERALEVGERGLSLGGEDAGLAAWVRDRAAECDCDELALRAARAAFEARPSTEAWHRLRALAGDGWPALRDELLANLPAHPQPRGAVDVLIAEGKLAEALDLVEDGTDYALAARVAEAACEACPERVIALCRRHAEAIMDGGNADAYERAAAWLRTARRAHAASSKRAEWRAYLDAVLERHRKKYRLRPLLEALRDGA